jgi:hypothetical protein
MRCVCLLALSLLLFAAPAAGNHPYQEMMTAAHDITSIQVRGKFGCLTPGIEPFPRAEQIKLSAEAESEDADCKASTLITHFYFSACRLMMHC